MKQSGESNVASQSSVTSRTVPQKQNGVRTRGREPAALTLDERGMICDCNRSGEQLFGYQRSELVWQHVSLLVPQLSGVALVRGGQVDPHLDFLCHCGHPFQVQKREGDVFPCELSVVHLEHDGRRVLRLMVRPAENENE